MRRILVFLFVLVFQSIQSMGQAIHLPSPADLGQNNRNQWIHQGLEVGTLIGNSSTIAFPLLNTSSDSITYKPVGISALGYLVRMTFWPGSGGGGGTPGGLDTYIQYNDAGTFGGDAGFTWDKNNFTLIVGAGSPNGSFFVMDDATATITFAANAITIPSLATGGPLNMVTVDGTGSLIRQVLPVTAFSAGNLSPLFTTSVATSTTTPALTFSLTNALAGTIFGNNASSTGAPAYTAVPILGRTGTTGTLGFRGLTNGTVTIQPQSTAGIWNFNLPITAGTAGQFLTSQGGGGTAMTWTTPGSGGSMTKQQIIDSLNTTTPSDIPLNNNISITSGSGIAALSSTALRVSNATAYSEIKSDGTFTQSDTTNSSSVFYSTRVTIYSPYVQTLASQPVQVVAPVTNYTIEVLSVTAHWLGGTGISYPGITSLYFYTDHCNSNQYQIDCPSTATPYMQRGAPLQTLIGGRDNVSQGEDVFVTTDADSGSGDATLYLFVNYRLIKTN